MRVLVTGATGFVGSHLARELSKEYEVIAIVREPSETNLGDVATIKGDLLESDFVGVLPDQVNTVIHLAQAPADFPNRADEMLTINAMSTLKLADYARKAGVKRFIFASTGSVYQPSENALAEMSSLSPSNFYALTKITAERILEFYEDWFEVCILRLFTPYGPGQQNRMIPKIIDLVDKNMPVVLRNGGQPKITPVYIEDLIDLIHESTTLSGNHVINIGGPEIVTVKEIAEFAGKELQKEPRFSNEDSEESWNLIGDFTEMTRLFQPRQLTSPEMGIKWTIRARQTV